MRRPSALALALLAATALPARADDLALRRVMLSVGGVGYFEYEAKADGAATLGLDLPLAQVDDVLASLVVFDDAGRVGGAELPEADGSRAAFAGVPFGPAAMASALDYLNALQGVTLDVRGPRPMHGQLLRAERVPAPLPPGARPGDVAPPPQTRVSLLTADGLQQFVLEDAESVQVSDPALREKIAAALATLRGHAAQEVRHLTLHAPGDGPRTIRVGYVAGAPLWKTTYRLILPAKDGDKARLQGWAVLENQSGADWNGVDLTLQYGNPVTFRQALYRSYYVQRPMVPVEVLGRILPTVDTRAATPAVMQASAMPALAGAARGLAKSAAPLPAPAPAAMNAEAMAAPDEETQATEAAEATLFHLASPVVLAAGHSATMPILDHNVPAERIGLVQQGRPHPLSAIRLRNDTGSSLPAGILTLYDPTDAAAFAGDARLGGVPNGETRLLAFAEDLRTGVDWQTSQAVTLIGVTAAEGVLHLRRRARTTERITLHAPAAEPRHLLIEIPRQPDSTLVLEDGLKPTEETATAWRVDLTLPAGATRVVIAHNDRTLEEAIELSEDEDTLAGVLGEQALDPAARAALQRVVDARTAVAAAKAQRDRLNARIADVERDEQRLRSNIAAVPAADALHLRLVRALEADETQIAGLRDQSAQAETALQKAQDALAREIAGLTI
jgi:hypothetical protein